MLLVWLTELTNNTKNGRLLARKANRLSSRSNTRNHSQMLAVKDMAPREVQISPLPPKVQYSIEVVKVIQIVVPVPASGNESISPSMLSAGIPGGLTYWSRIRFESFRAYAKDVSTGSSELAITVSPQTDWNQPPFSIIDSGTAGNVRPRLGFKLGLLDRSRWFGTADTTELFVVSGNPDEDIIIQASVVIMSPGL